ncbi:hypothetical protein DIURU_001514 [Diutina rugosa]|uniref:WW domain-containing protein n=1 Tax=Diutina rugosa TaxID=5481 RepID=A0A642USZ2_DIURU|nr:uncharacterized protein DIURU_001514 [Diutina rugosa]KAA8905086.1 hypothetical protein DIURU_001514 [Diutina rugosa]
MPKEWELRYDASLNSHYYVNPYDNSIHFDSPEEVKRPRTNLLGSIRRNSTGGLLGKIKRQFTRSPQRSGVPSSSSTRSSTVEWSVKTVTPPTTQMPVVLPPRRSRSLSTYKSSVSKPHSKSVSKSPQKSPLSTPPRELSPVPSLCSSTVSGTGNGVYDDVLLIEATLNDDWSIDSEDFDITSYDISHAHSYYQAEHDASSTVSKLPEDRLELRMSLWSEIH